MATISELYSQKKNNDIFEGYLKRVKEMRFSVKADRREKNAEILYYLLAASYEKGYYCDCLDVLKKLNEIKEAVITNWNAGQLMYFSKVALESLVYCLLNNESEKLMIAYDIATHIENTISYQDNLIQNYGLECGEVQNNLRFVYEEYKIGKLPIYEVAFYYPFDPIIPDYVFDLEKCYPYISMSVVRVPRDKDSLTCFKFKAYGFINIDLNWEGPRWENRHKLPAVKKALSIVNLMLLQAVKASPGKMVLPYNIEQVSTVSMHQYRCNGVQTIFNGLVTGTDFTAHWVGNNCSWHSFTPEEMQELNRRVVATYDNKSFVTTFHHATNLLSGGFYTESFLLFCFCCEGFVYHWCEEIAKIYGEEQQYIEFSERKQSCCDDCDLYIDRSIEPHNKGMEPTLFSNLKYLEEKRWINSTECKKLRELVSKIRQDKLRNNIVHGKVFGATKANADEALTYILEMQEVFLRIVDKGKKEMS